MIESIRGRVRGFRRSAALGTGAGGGAQVVSGVEAVTQAAAFVAVVLVAVADEPNGEPSDGGDGDQGKDEAWGHERHCTRGARGAEISAIGKPPGIAADLAGTAKHGRHARAIWVAPSVIRRESKRGGVVG